MPRWPTWLERKLTEPIPECEVHCEKCLRTGELCCCICDAALVCEHCECIKRNHPCCHCGIWLKDIEPIVVAGNEMTLNPIAMEYERRYSFRLTGSTQWSYAVRHRNESVEITREPQIWRKSTGPLIEDAETVAEDCRNSGGWLQIGVVCRVDRDPRCEYHRRTYGSGNTAEYRAMRAEGRG